MSKLLNLTIRALHRKDCDIICNSTDKIKKEDITKIAEKLGVIPGDISIVCKGKDFEVSNPEKILEDYCVRNGDILHIILKINN